MSESAAITSPRLNSFQSYLSRASDHSLRTRMQIPSSLEKDASAAQFRLEWQSILQDPNAETTGQSLLHFASRLSEAKRDAAAVEVYRMVASSEEWSETTRNQARHSLNVLQGGGSTGEQLALFLPRLGDEAISLRSLGSLAGAGLIGRLAYAGIFSRLASNARWLGTAGKTGVQILAGLGALAFEAPTFAALNSGLGGTPLNARELGASFLFLGAVRGTQGLARIALTGKSRQQWVGAAASFAGVLGANQLIRATELRPHDSGNGLLLESFASWLQVMVSDRALHGLLGSRYGAGLRELEARAETNRPRRGAFGFDPNLAFASVYRGAPPSAKPTIPVKAAASVMMASSLAEQGVAELPAVKQAELVRGKQISSEELTKHYLDKIEAKNPELTAFVQVMKKSAIREARRIDKSEDRNAPFFGVPIGIKDLNFVRGSFTRFGSRAFKYFYTPFDDKMVKQLKRGGFVIVGKLATAEFGAMPVTEPPIHAPTRNPWNPNLSAGGSSGGSGAAVASGMIPIAQGSDGAGSIRIPSAFNHLYGFKPSRDLVPDPYGRDHPRRLSVVGPLARSVEDAAAMLDLMSGTSVPFPAKMLALARSSLVDAMQRYPRRLNIGLLLETPLTPTDPDISDAVKSVASALERLGHRVSEKPALQAEVEEFLPLWQKLLGAAPVPFSSLLSPVPRWLRAAGKKLVPEDVDRQHDALNARIRNWFGNADIVLSPTVAIPPPAIGSLERATPAETFQAAAALGAFTALYNVSGQPAASLPIGLTSQGIPIGLQIAGRDLQDGVVLALSRQIEEMLPWSHRRAP